ncbi:hypothetical protein MTO96_001337 [Rhipicephalus appendiculatus]
MWTERIRVDSRAKPKKQKHLTVTASRDGLYGRFRAGPLSSGARCGRRAVSSGKPRRPFCQLPRLSRPRFVDGRKPLKRRSPLAAAKACFLSCPQREPGNYWKGFPSTQDKTFNALSKQPGKSLFSNVRALLFNSEL